MTEGRLRSIEGLGVPVIVVASIVIAAIYISNGLTSYQVQTDQRIASLEQGNKALSENLKAVAASVAQISDKLETSNTRLEKSFSHLIMNVRNDVSSSVQTFDRAACQEVMLALKVKNPSMQVIDCYNLPSAQRHDRRGLSWQPTIRRGD